LPSPRRFCREVNDEDARPTGRELDLTTGLDEPFGGLDRAPDNLVVLHRSHAVAARWRVLAEQVSLDTQLNLENSIRDLGATFQLECHLGPTWLCASGGRGVAEERDHELLRRQTAVMIHRIARHTEYVDAARECEFEIAPEPQIGRPEDSVILRSPTQVLSDDTPAV